MRIVPLAFRLAVLMLTIFGDTLTQIHRYYSKDALFLSVQPEDASTSRRVIARFQALSEVACCQECFQRENCNYKLYDGTAMKCELLELVSKEDVNGEKALMKIRRIPDQILNDELEKKCLSNGKETLLNCTAKGTYQSCKAALQSNGFQKAIYRIRPINFDTPFDVECMKDTSGMYFAVLHHNNENPTYVPQGYEAHGSYRFSFTYSLDMSLIVSLINQSSHCQQFTKARCRGVFFHRIIYGVPWNTWLSGRNGQKLDFWGGGPSNGTGCACGITKTCDVASYNCNCDANDSKLRSDEGNVIKKELLPITSIIAGDHCFA